MDTWIFAHHYCGRIWYKSGLGALSITFLILLFVIGKSEKVTGSVGGIICLCQVVLLLSAVFFTEHALHKEFDKNGKRI